MASHSDVKTASSGVISTDGVGAAGAAATEDDVVDSAGGAGAAATEEDVVDSGPAGTAVVVVVVVEDASPPTGEARTCRPVVAKRTNACSNMKDAEVGCMRG